MYAVQKFLGINAGIVKMVCDKKNHVKSGKSKIDQCFYTFEYINQDQLPKDYLKAVKPTLYTPEEAKLHKKVSVTKWQQKTFTCNNCQKVFKNNYKYKHNKICKPTE